MPLLFIPKETTTDEARVAATPETVKQYCKRGLKVVVEAGAGASAHISDQLFEEAGATITTTPTETYKQADVIIKINPPHYREDLGQDEARLFKAGAVLISHLWPQQAVYLVKELTDQKVTAFAMDQIPRISRAQSMDALSSQSNIAGYKAVLLAADKLPKMFPLMMTAAGTIKPARVVIIGAGVAGLQAIATAKRLGAIVEVSDIRPEVKEQVESLGGRFIEVESDESLQDEGGYAKEVSDSFKRKQQQVLHAHIADADVVVTTALVPGKRAPMLVPEDAVKAMRPGSVIVDLAVTQGGNCALSEEGKVVVKEGVTIIGYRNLPALQPVDASAMYAKNVLAVMQHLYDKEGQLTLDFEDEITSGSVITHDGIIRVESINAELGTDAAKGPQDDAKDSQASAESESKSPSNDAGTETPEASKEDAAEASSETSSEAKEDAAPEASEAKAADEADNAAATQEKQDEKTSETNASDDTKKETSGS